MGNKQQSHRELTKARVVLTAQNLIRSSIALGDEDFVMGQVEFIVSKLLDQADAKISQLQKQLAEKEQEKEQELPY